MKEKLKKTMNDLTQNVKDGIKKELSIDEQSIAEKNNPNIKTYGVITIDEENNRFKIKGAVKGKIADTKGKKVLKATVALATGGTSLLIPDGKTKVGTDIWYDFADLLTYELIEDNGVVSSGGVASAVIGGLAFGGDGAIIGGLTGKKKSKKMVENIIVRITLNDNDNPMVLVPFIKKPVKTKSSDYRKALEDSRALISRLEIIAKKVDNEPNIQQSNNNQLEQLKQLKELLDMGAITEEEFEAKKKDLLGL
ncbi:SHOCT domain-containing protein [Anaerofustis sp.]|uniref:SHOCT domain-containing protein n=1 Tax=Anaerofustis sp. TaxID=1872517 RepID=UPI0025BFFC13|nr:SHOCT domain-containing protein [Anaerofustis sp.]